jgi:hypothetical protein
MHVTYKGIVRGRVVVLEGDPMLPEGTRVTIVPEPIARRPLRVLSVEELQRRKAVCERLEALADRIARTARPGLNLGDDVSEARRELEERV